MIDIDYLLIVVVLSTDDLRGVPTDPKAGPGFQG
jgi:hypothetical protein